VSFALIQETWMKAQPYLAHIHCGVIRSLADGCQRLGEAETGLAMIAAALEQASGWPQLARYRLLTTRAVIHLYGCNLLQAERDFQANLYQARQLGFVVIAIMNQVGLGVIASARHQLEAAETYYVEVLTAPYLQSGRFAVLSASRLIELYAFQGCPERARPWLKRLRNHAQLVGLRYLREQVAALEAYCAMTCGDLPQALAWELIWSQDAPATTMFNADDRIPMTRVRILLAEGSPASLHKANQILQELSRFHESEHRWYYLVETQIMQSLVWTRLGQMELALAELGQAVQRAVPNGMIGPFVQQGQPIRHLLYALRKQAQPTYLVDLLLAAFPAENTAPKLPAEGETASLTDRELEVLRLLADRLSKM
jgi:LuxR family maltose regulon positive regulatory protein